MQHLEGITVLNEYMTYKDNNILMILLVGMFLAGLVAVLAAGKEWYGVCAVFSLLGIVCFITIIVVGVTGVYRSEAGIAFECIIDKSVSFQELTSVYEIVEQRGDIYVLKFLK